MGQGFPMAQGYGADLFNNFTPRQSGGPVAPRHFTLIPVDYDPFA
jgi:hypothetical protein